MTITDCSRHSIQMRGRPFMALVLAPQQPVADWLTDLDEWLQHSPGFFTGRPMILDVSALSLSKIELADIIADLHGREIRLMGIEGTNPSWLGLGMPPLVSNGRQAGVIEVLDPTTDARTTAHRAASSLLIQNPVRSGQSVIFPEGDVTVIGSVASGAEVIAGGSIHVYGALRGRASAGSSGDARARIFCSKFEAELLAIDGLYTAIDQIEPHLRGRPVQAWLDCDKMMITMAAVD